MAKPVETGTFSNLGHTQAFEAVNVIRRRWANFHLGPGQKMTPHHEAEYMTATGSRSSHSRNSLARGSGPYMVQKQQAELNLQKVSIEKQVARIEAARCQDLADTKQRELAMKAAFEMQLAQLKQTILAEKRSGKFQAASNR
jgi:hypothetical protein